MADQWNCFYFLITPVWILEYHSPASCAFFDCIHPGFDSLLVTFVFVRAILLQDQDWEAVVMYTSFILMIHVFLGCWELYCNQSIHYSLLVCHPYCAAPSVSLWIFCRASLRITGAEMESGPGLLLGPECLMEPVGCIILQWMAVSCLCFFSSQLMLDQQWLKCLPVDRETDTCCLFKLLTSVHCAHLYCLSSNQQKLLGSAVWSI